MHIHETTKLRLKMSNSVGYYQMSHMQQILFWEWRKQEKTQTVLFFSFKGSINSCLELWHNNGRKKVQTIGLMCLNEKLDKCRNAFCLGCFLLVAFIWRLHRLLSSRDHEVHSHELASDWQLARVFISRVWNMNLVASCLREKWKIPEGSHLGLGAKLFSHSQK